jgi:hypothetical protein
MPSWGQILGEIQGLIPTHQGNTFNFIRTKYLEQLSDYTGRNTIIYATRWTSGDAPPNLVSINDEDIHAFMEAIAGLQGNSLDLIIHSGGGSAEATDALVSYLRLKFDDIRIIIPQAAMSAGTMLACAANVIVMGKQSSIGPIDPQFILQTSVGLQALPAHAIKEQFKMAQEDCRDNPKNLNSWLPMLSQYGPALLIRCQDQIDFGKELVENWLSTYMFSGEETILPKSIAEYLSNHSNFKTHGKHINIEKAIEIGLKIQQLEAEQEFQDKVLSAFHATMHCFGMTQAAKVIANHNGNCFIKQFNIAPVSNRKP